MLNEEKCKQALKLLTFAVIRNYSNTKYDCLSRKHILKSRYQRQHDMIEKLIKEHFEFLEVLKECGLGELTPDDLRVVIKAGQYNAKQLNELRNQEPLNFEEYEKEIAFLVSTIDKMAETLATRSEFFDKEEIKNRYYYFSEDGECGE